MAEGLKPHHHQYFEYDCKSHFDSRRHVIVKKVTLYVHDMRKTLTRDI